MVATVRILITTDYLTPGDDIDPVLRDRGHHTIHSPAVGERPPGELARLLADADAALVASVIPQKAVIGPHIGRPQVIR